MRLRAPTMDDHAWIYEEYKASWQHRRPITPDLVADWIERWMARTDEICRVAEISEPIGLTCYRRRSAKVAEPFPWFVYIENTLVRQVYRDKGYGSKMWRLIRDELLDQGVIGAEFKSKPGVVRDLLGSKFQNIDGVHGRVTWDMEI